MEFENADVRVLRIKYGPHEKSIQHSHPAGIVIAVTDVTGKFTMADGSVQNNSYRAGQVLEAPAGTHLPENTSDKPFELILIEMKSKSGKASTPDAVGATNSMAGEMGVFPPANVKWMDGPASLPAGAKYAVLEGDPAKEGFFTMRLSLPDGYIVPPHMHPKVEHVTVISGSFNLGMGERFDKSTTREMTSGAFGYWPAGMKHFAWANGPTVLQLHGIGPWSITYVNSSDDPRNAKE